MENIKFEKEKEKEIQIQNPNPNKIEKEIEKETLNLNAYLNKNSKKFGFISDIKKEANNESNKLTAASKILNSFIVKTIDVELINKITGKIDEEYPYRRKYSFEITNENQEIKEKQENHEDKRTINIITNEEAEKKEILKNNNPIKFRYNFREIIRSILPHKKLDKRNEIYLNCKKVIDKYIDISNLIEIIQEFKIIKSLLFNNSQNYLLNKFKRPAIKIKKNTNDFLFRRSDLEHDELNVEIKEPLENIMKEIDFDELDSKIINQKLLKISKFLNEVDL